MSSADLRPGAAERDRLLALLDAAAAASARLRFWWRDDDAVDVTPELERLLATAARHCLPLALAIVPAEATPALAARLEPEARIAVLQHGWTHRRHNPEGEKKAEFGDHRPLPEMLDELRRGARRLGELVPSRFLPVLAPPWNRIGDAVRAARGEAGLVGLSTYGRKAAPDPDWVNTHVDLVDWSRRAPLGREAAFRQLCREAEARLAGDPEPIGILTHHLVGGAAAADLLDEVLDVIGSHPAADWPSIDAVFPGASAARR